uniref:Uncharacterized protein n=1 Tax=Cannabis sativa TaxID=3483 RepID=A0A803PKE7_CANSA
MGNLWKCFGGFSEEKKQGSLRNIKKMGKWDFWFESGSLNTGSSSIGIMTVAVGIPRVARSTAGDIAFTEETKEFSGVAP